ncbi:uncharacterized protein BDR25DRAFT_302476 [Lindgomyces ingoldianus]|uniref:Uncharacterized protein n=1 Tax=Lindgomyces ingoldianus TaxID=673940 RepID=A0ACB6R119_9PLEO|nr:uncharacterized protein BDR25DRAFT_302476 [Lindgomyces ingoldianus]KAF2472876.1 hypothetical protein BDR25DRAFT_302476 [Lindgomyces ingoldianus]
MAHPNAAVQITTASGVKYEPRTTTVLASAFSADPVMAYFLNSIPRGPARSAALHKLFHCMFSAATLKDAIFYESSYPNLTPANQASPNTELVQEPGFQSAAVIMLPGQKVDDLNLLAWLSLIKAGILGLIWTAGLTRFRRVLFEYPALADGVKKTTFNKHEKWYYILMIGTEESHRGKGLCPALIRDLQKKASGEGLPIWLEATSAGSRDVYKKVGFQLVEEGGPFILGKGVADAAGEVATGESAVGVEIWAMVWYPEGYVKPGNGRTE